MSVLSTKENSYKIPPESLNKLGDTQEQSTQICPVPIAKKRTRAQYLSRIFKRSTFWVSCLVEINNQKVTGQPLQMMGVQINRKRSPCFNRPIKVS